MSSRIPTTPGMARISALDGLRGLAACVVFLWHTLDIFWPHVIGSQVPGAVPNYHDYLSPALRCLPLGWAINANFAVCLFFALSGFVLTLLVLSKSHNWEVSALIAQRWFRLLPVVAVGSVLGFITLQSGLRELHDLRVVNGSTNPNIFSEYLLEHVHVVELAKQVFWQTWGQTMPPENLFGRVLWTIGLEFQGSIILFALVPIFRKTRSRLTVHLTILLIGATFLGAVFMLFALGSLLADLYSRDRIPARLTSRLAGCLLLLAGLLLASIHPSFDGALWLPVGDVSLGSHARFVRLICYTLGSGALILAALFLPPFKSFLEWGFPRFLGRISYSLYATHQPLLHWLGIPVFFALFPTLGYFQAASITGVLALAVCMMVSACTTSFIDVPANQISKKWVSQFVSEKET